MATITESFTGSNGDVSANWTDNFGGAGSPAGFPGGKLQISSNQVTGVNTQYRENRYTGSALQTAHYYAQIKYKSGTLTNFALNLVVRGVDTGANRDAYIGQLGYNGSAITWKIIRQTNSVETTLSTGTTTVAADDVFRFEANASALTMKKNGTALGSVSDSTYTAAGAPGLGLYQQATILWDDFEAGDLVTALIQEPFTYADGALPTTRWTDNFGNGNLLVSSNQITGGNNVYRESQYTGLALDSGDQYSQIVFKSVSAGTVLFNLCARTSDGHTSSTKDGYELNVNAISGAWRLYKVTDGVETGLGSGGTTTITANDVWRIEAQGTSIRAKKNGSTLETVTDATYSTGRPALGIFQSAANLLKLDDFEAGTALAAGFAVAPFVASRTDTSFTLGYTLSGAGNYWQIAVTEGDTAPSDAQIKAGVSYTGATVYGASTEATAGGADSLLLSISGSPPPPILDLFIIGNAGSDTPQVVGLGKKLNAPTGYQDVILTATTGELCALLTSVGVTVQVGGVLRIPLLTDDGNGVIPDTAGNLHFDLNGDLDRQYIQFRYYDTDIGWRAPDNYYLENQPPVRQGTPPVYLLEKDEVIASVDLNAYMQSPHGDTLTWAVTSGAVGTGLAVASNGLMTGTPTVIQSTWTATLTATDAAGETNTLTITGATQDTIQMPTLIGVIFNDGTSADVLHAIETAGLILNPSYPFQYSATYPEGYVMDQSPAPGVLVLVGTVVTVTVSLGSPAIDLSDIEVAQDSGLHTLDVTDLFPEDAVILLIGVLPPGWLYANGVLTYATTLAGVFGPFSFAMEGQQLETVEFTITVTAEPVVFTPSQVFVSFAQEITRRVRWWLEGSAFTKVGRITDENNDLYVPQTLEYSVVCETTGQTVVGWTNITPASEFSIVLTSEVNRILNRHNSKERKVLLIRVNQDTDNAAIRVHDWEVRRTHDPDQPLSWRDYN